MLKIRLPDRYQVFYADDMPLNIVSTVRGDDQEIVLKDGRRLQAVTVKPQQELLDLGKAHPKKTVYAVAVGTFYADRPGMAVIGAGADWWFDCFCNGQYAYSTPVSGNAFWPPSSENYIFAIPVRAGRNDLVFRVKAGAGGCQLAVAAAPEGSDYNKPLPLPQTPGIVFGPYLTNPGTASVRINYVVQGRQPLELQYRKAGNQKWLTIHNLQGGQIVDNSPVVSFDLAGLKPGCEYEYRALRRVPPTYHQSEPEAIRKFRTFSDKPQKFSFFAMTDTHLNKTNKLALIDTLFAARPELKKADMFVHLGDFASYLDDFQLEVFDSLLKRIPAEMPIITLRGNHEFDGAQAQEYLRYLSLKNRKSYGVFRLGGVCFVVLDTGHHLPPGSKNPFQRYTGLNKLDTLLAEQRDFLEQAVKTPEFQTAEYRIVLAHIAPDCPDKYMSRRLDKMAKEFFGGSAPAHRIDLWFSGHTHKYLVQESLPEWPFTTITLGGGHKKSIIGNALYVQIAPGKITLDIINSDGTKHESFEYKNRKLTKL